jgi:hypothetical protein
MSWIGRHGRVQDPAEIATQATGALEAGRFAAVLSGIALLVSGFSLWDTSLKASDVRVFVSPVAQYSSPYQNSNFEVFALPITLTNEGARTGTVLSMELAVTDPRTKLTKRFYAADFGRWTMDKARASAFEPFAPMSLAGRTSRTESVIFYPLTAEEKPDEMVREIGSYQFKLTLDLAEEGSLLSGTANPAISFERELRFYDARAFQTTTLPLYAKDGTSATNATPEKK